jgi:hypothetical protein
MGLDMYLVKKTFIGVENEVDLKIKKDDKLILIKSNNVNYISEK